MTENRLAMSTFAWGAQQRPQPPHRTIVTRPAPYTTQGRRHARAATTTRRERTPRAPARIRHGARVQRGALPAAMRRQRTRPGLRQPRRRPPRRRLNGRVPGPLRPPLSAARNVGIDRATGDWALIVAASCPSKPCAKRDQSHPSARVTVFQFGTSAGRRGVRLRMPGASNGDIAVKRAGQRLERRSLELAIRLSTARFMKRKVQQGR